MELILKLSSFQTETITKRKSKVSQVYKWSPSRFHTTSDFEYVKHFGRNSFSYVLIFCSNVCLGAFCRWVYSRGLPSRSNIRVSFRRGLLWLVILNVGFSVSKSRSRSLLCVLGYRRGVMLVFNVPLSSGGRYCGWIRWS